MTTMTHATTQGELITADLKINEKARNRTPGYVVRKAAIDPNPPKAPRALTWQDAIALDIRGEAAFSAPCVDCGRTVTVYPQDLEHDDDGTEVAFTPMCTKDQQVREVWAALHTQHEHEMARRRARVEAGV